MRVNSINPKIIYYKPYKENKNISFQGIKEKKEEVNSYLDFSKLILKHGNIKALKSLIYLDKGNIHLANLLLRDDDFPKNRIWEFLGYAYEDNTELVEETYKNNRDEIIKLLKDGYKISCTRPKKSNHFNMIFEKTKKDINGINSEYTVIFDRFGRISKSKCTTLITQDDRIIKQTRTTCPNYICNSFYKKGEIIDTLSGEMRTSGLLGGEYKLETTTSSDLLEGVYDSVVYNLEGYENSPDVAEKIERGEISGYQTSKTVKNKDGTIVHHDIYERDGYQTKRFYTQNKDNTQTSLSYEIKNPNNEAILSLQRTFELNGNISITTINDKKYVAKFDDDKKTVQITDEKGAETTIKFKQKMMANSKESQEILWNLIKKAPADAILKFKDIAYLEYSGKNGQWLYKHGGAIETRNNLGTLSHELGHYSDATKNGDFPMSKVSKQKQDEFENIISTDPELISVYKSEIRRLNKELAKEEIDNIDYFSETSESFVQGLGELVAEVNMLMTTIPDKDIMGRSLYLMKYFPKTISTAAKLLGY